MKPKIALLILFFLAIIIGLVFLLLYVTNKPVKEEGVSDNFKEEVTGLDIREVLEKEKRGEELTSEEEEIFDKVINSEVEKKFETINTRRQIIKKEGYTQEEVDFIANPTQTVEDEIMVEQSIPSDNTLKDLYEQSEKDTIVNQE